MSEAAIKILVVDDDMFTAELIGLVFESAGYETVLVDRGIHALEKLSIDPGFRLVISDMHMPLMNGVQLFEQMRKQGFMQPFILLTGQDGVQLKAQHPSLDAVVQKNESFQETLADLADQLLSK